MNPSKRHQTMVMMVRSGTPVVCMAMAPSERRESIPTSSWENTSLDAPTCVVSALMMVIILEALTEQSP